MALLNGILTRISQNELCWRYVLNCAPTLAYEHTPLFAESARVLADLNRDGIAVTSTSALLGNDHLYGELTGAVDLLLAERSAEVRARRVEAVETSDAHKSFLFEMLGTRPQLDFDSPYARVAVDERILGIANEYFGMYTRLRDYNVWLTLVSKGPARQSQLWHRDREDRLILKVFIYLSDVDEEAGPLCYAPRTHAKGTVRREPTFEFERGVRRSNDEQMSAIVPADRWITATGPKGTIIFVDTRGYHRGGFCLARERLLYQCMFTSLSSDSLEHFSRPQSKYRGNSAKSLALAAQRRRIWLSLPKS